MTIELFELRGKDPDLRFSPNVWPTRMALVHKQLPFTSVPWRFTEKDAIAFSGQKMVPVIRDAGKSVHDSWAIANYLEDTYPDRPSLFGGPAGKAGIVFFRRYVTTIYGAAAPIAVLPVWNCLDEEDQAYFRDTREARLGRKLEDVCGDIAQRLDTFRTALGPMRAMLGDQPFAGGDAPLYSDHMLFGVIQWLRCVADVDLFEKDDPVADWVERMLDAYDGHARAAKTCRTAA
ncbi:MAG: glutathione S-transferase family protein [Alphaproteobacteria bacterium]|nr:glutathione S-transferase family protein [Alphaproteobacteria bacterium]